MILLGAVISTTFLIPPFQLGYNFHPLSVYRPINVSSSPTQLGGEFKKLQAEKSKRISTDYMRCQPMYILSEREGDRKKVVEREREIDRDGWVELMRELKEFKFLSGLLLLCRLSSILVLACFDLQIFLFNF